METAKTGRRHSCPLSCRMIRANSAEADNIHLIVTDPYGAGWMFRVEPTAFDAERAGLLDAAAYREGCACASLKVGPGGRF